MPTKTQMEDALKAISRCVEDKLTPQQVVALAEEGLSTAPKVNAFEEKVKELTNFISDGRFQLLFAQHDDVVKTLNDAKILSPAGKEWTRSNVSKIMKPVRDAVTERMNASAPSGQAETPEPAVEATEAAEIAAEKAQVEKLTPDEATEEAKNIAAAVDEEIDELAELENLIADDEDDDALPAL